MQNDNLRSDAFPLVAFSFDLRQVNPQLHEQFYTPFKLYWIHDELIKLHILFGFKHALFMHLFMYIISP